MRQRATVAGFTLLECLVALAILAVALSAALRAVGSTAQSAATLREHTLGSWVAHNRLAELRASGVFPALGVQQGEAMQAGRLYRWRQTTERTPNPLFRKVEIRVFDAAQETPLTQVSAFMVRPLR